MTTENIKNKVWEKEENSYFFKCPDTGYNCYIGRHAVYGHLCAYVRIDHHHPLFGIDSDTDAFDILVQDIEVHGGVNYSGKSTHFENNKNRYYWSVGFHCNHIGDYAPYAKYLGDQIPPDVEYRDIDYVKADCLYMARKLKQLERIE